MLQSFRSSFAISLNSVVYIRTLGELSLRIYSSSGLVSRQLRGSSIAPIFAQANSSSKNSAQFWDNIAISAIACDYNNPGVMYVGTGEGWFNADAVGGAGIWKTEDGGLSWVHLQNTVNDNFYNIQKIVVHPITSEIFVATSGYYGNSDGGIYLSDNGGDNWTLVLESSGSRSRAADIEITSNGTIYATLGIFYTDGLYRSENGRNWTKLNNGSNGFPYNNFIFCCDAYKFVVIGHVIYIIVTIFVIATTIEIHCFFFGFCIDVYVGITNKLFFNDKLFHYQSPLESA